MTHRFGTALVALALFASCSSSFEALGGDAGDVAMDDACVGCVEDADVHFDLIGNPDRDGGSENRGPVSERALGEVPVRIDPR